MEAAALSFQAEDGIRYGHVTGVQTCALPNCRTDAHAELLDHGRAHPLAGGAGEVRARAGDRGPGPTGVTGFVMRFDACLQDRKSTRLNCSHVAISYAVFCLKKKK